MKTKEAILGKTFEIVDINFQEILLRDVSDGHFVGCNLYKITAVAKNEQDADLEIVKLEPKKVL